MMQALPRKIVLHVTDASHGDELSEFSDLHLWHPERSKCALKLRAAAEADD
jgi:hypothetical protein